MHFEKLFARLSQYNVYISGIWHFNSALLTAKNVYTASKKSNFGNLTKLIKIYYNVLIKSTINKSKMYTGIELRKNQNFRLIA